MPTRNISLTDALDALIEREVASGRYQNASEVVRAGLRLFEQRRREDEARLKALHQAIDEALGEADVRGDLEVGDIDAFVDDAVGQTRAARQATSGVERA